MTFINGFPFRKCTPCGQCGLSHGEKEKCCAQKARCNKCNRIGHFARVCFHSAVKQKSDVSKKRDQERMTEFIRRKTAECTLPFFNEEDAYFQHNTTNNSVSQVSSAEFQKLKSFTDTLTKTMKSENVCLVMKSQKLRDSNEQLRNELSIKKLELHDLRRTSTCEINTLKEKLEVASPKLEKMDRLITELKKLYEDYEKLRLMHSKNAYEMMMMESNKNDQIDDLEDENKKLKHELAQFQKQTKNLCYKRGDTFVQSKINENPHHEPSNTLWRAGLPQTWRGGQSNRGRSQGQRGQYQRNGR